jgi:hypothetical protein
MIQPIVGEWFNTFFSEAHEPILATAPPNRRLCLPVTKDADFYTLE